MQLLQASYGYVLFFGQTKSILVVFLIRRVFRSAKFHFPTGYLNKMHMYNLVGVDKCEEFNIYMLGL